MNKFKLFLIGSFFLMVALLGITACQPVEPVDNFSRQDDSGPGPSSSNVGPVYSPEERASRSSEKFLDPETRILIEQITQFTDDHWAEMAAIHRPLNDPDRITQYTDDHWVELAAILYPTTVSSLDDFLKFTDDHWAEMEEIHQ